MHAQIKNVRSPNMKSHRLPMLGALLAVGISCLVSGCSNPENGTKEFVPPTPEQTKQYQDQQIKSIQDNPNISDDQKQRIIGMYKGENRPQTTPAPATGAGK